MVAWRGVHAKRPYLLLGAGLPLEVGEAIEAIDVGLGAEDEVLEPSHDETAVFVAEVDEPNASSVGLAQVDNILIMVRMTDRYAGVADISPGTATIDGAVHQDTFDLIGTSEVDGDHLLPAVAIVAIEQCERRFAEHAKGLAKCLYDVRVAVASLA